MMDSKMLERYEVLAALGSGLIVALITALAVPLAQAAPVTPAAVMAPLPQGPAAAR